MAINKVFRVLVASDGSASAKAAVTTVLGFPWPARTRVQGVTASLVPPNYRQAVVLAALGRTDAPRRIRHLALAADAVTMPYGASTCAHLNSRFRRRRS